MIGKRTFLSISVIFKDDNNDVKNEFSEFVGEFKWKIVNNYIILKVKKSIVFGKLLAQSNDLLFIL